MKIVYVKWRDAHCSNDDWTDGDFIDHWHDTIFETVGFLIETPLKNEITIAQTIKYDGRKSKIWGIPKKYIIEMKELADL